MPKVRTIADYGDLHLLSNHSEGMNWYTVELSGKDCRDKSELHFSRDYAPARAAYDAIKKTFETLEIELGDTSRPFDVD